MNDHSCDILILMNIENFYTNESIDYNHINISTLQIK